MNFNKIVILALIGFVVILLNTSPDWLLIAMVILLIISLLYQERD